MKANFCDRLAVAARMFYKTMDLTKDDNYRPGDSIQFTLLVAIKAKPKRWYDLVCPTRLGIK